MMADQELIKLASEAMRASVRLSNEIMGIMDLPASVISSLNRTATIRTMQENLKTIRQFVNKLEEN
jgi:Fic family protein